MLFQCRVKLKNAMDDPKIRSVLEIGSGLNATPVIVKKFDRGAIDRYVSLETSSEWAEKVNGKCKREVVTLADFGFDEERGIFAYDYSSVYKFDLIFVDGPGKLQGDDYSAAVKLCEQPDFCLSSPTAAGIQSIHMIEAFRSNIHDDTVIMVDGRRAAVLYYLSRYQDEFDFFFGGTPYPKKRLKEILKPEFRHLAKFNVGEITTMVRKKK